MIDKKTGFLIAVNLVTIGAFAIVAALIERGLLYGCR